MKVYDYEVSEMQYASAVARMQEGEFILNDIRRALVEAGVPESSYDGRRVQFIAGRVADRIVQQKRKLGQIGFNGACWKWRPHG